ncbi:predicted protein [Plenodomus lingam JN3]|uniref:Predicted protein n=1 Tax=Leptosphaeria maculans (strain JN3 / isolate v23.1.3 / race Av1-4-5-6-7-8) TaxID=985895 RepID=E4ZVI8_LEPMJ|nr:predicted protein [Plenodomus lingam JN3]CBX95614.1 predicted protein [Plenodomus lingam JN3]
MHNLPPRFPDWRAIPTSQPHVFPTQSDLCGGRNFLWESRGVGGEGVVWYRSWWGLIPSALLRALCA